MSLPGPGRGRDRGRRARWRRRPAGAFATTEGGDSDGRSPAPTCHRTGEVLDGGVAGTPQTPLRTEDLRPLTDRGWSRDARVVTDSSDPPGTLGALPHGAGSAAMVRPPFLARSSLGAAGDGGPRRRGGGPCDSRTTGRRSARPRDVLLGYVQDGDNFVTLAMHGWGAPEPGRAPRSGPGRRPSSCSSHAAPGRDELEDQASSPGTGSSTPSTWPSGSSNIAKRPTPGTVMGATTSLPPRSTARRKARSSCSTCT